jgi:hypothetical protein
MLSREEFEMSTPIGFIVHYQIYELYNEPTADIHKFIRESINANFDRRIRSWYDAHCVWYEVYFSKLWKVLE